MPHLILLEGIMGESVNILIPMIAIGVALGGLILTSNRGLRQEMM